MSGDASKKRKRVEFVEPDVTTEPDSVPVTVPQTVAEEQESGRKAREMRRQALARELEAKFDSDEEAGDQVLNDDAVGGVVRAGRATKAHRVADDDDDEDDMFGGSDDDDGDTGAGAGAGAAAADDDDDDDDDEDLEDLTPVQREARRLEKLRKEKHATKAVAHVSHAHGERDDGMTRDQAYNAEMGNDMEPFNLKQERKEGYFDATGNFVWQDKGEEGVAKDAWLSEMDAQKVISHKALEIQAAQSRALEEAAEEAQQPIDHMALMATIVKHLQPRETVTRGLRRLSGKSGTAGGGTKARRQRRKKKVDGGGDGGGAGAGAASGAASAETAAAFSELTEASFALMGAGFSEVYEMTKERLQSLLNPGGAAAGAAAGSTPSVGGVDPAQAPWEFKWSADPGGQIYTHPFAEVQAWVAQGYFSTCPDAMARPQGTGAWQKIAGMSW